MYFVKLQSVHLSLYSKSSDHTNNCSQLYVKYKLKSVGCSSGQARSFQLKICKAGFPLSIQGHSTPTSGRSVARRSTGSSLCKHRDKCHGINVTTLTCRNWCNTKPFFTSVGRSGLSQAKRIYTPEEGNT